MSLTRAQRRNLAKLAAYLEGLPRDYRHFNMGYYLKLKSNGDELAYVRKNGGVASCGTVACAVGHGPAAGILFRSGDFVWGEPHWRAYAERFVPKEHGPDCEWAFGGSWSHHDNHHWGAAARIRYLLKHGRPPEDFEGDPSRKWRKVYAPFDKRHTPTPA